jgi:hypothetical protein
MAGFSGRASTVLLQDKFGIRELSDLFSFSSFSGKGKTMAAKWKVDAELWTPNKEQVVVQVNTLKVAMTVFDLAKLSDDHRAILDAVDDDVYGLILGVSTDLFLCPLMPVHCRLLYS